MNTEFFILNLLKLLFLLGDTLSPWLDYRGAIVSFETHPCDQLAIVNWMDKVESLLLTINASFISLRKWWSVCLLHFTLYSLTTLRHVLVT